MKTSPSHAIYAWDGFAFIYLCHPRYLERVEYEPFRAVHICLVLNRIHTSYNNVYGVCRMLGKNVFEDDACRGKR